MTDDDEVSVTRFEIVPPIDDAPDFVVSGLWECPCGYSKSSFTSSSSGVTSVVWCPHCGTSCESIPPEAS